MSASAEFRRLLFRDAPAEITQTGAAMPGNVPTQRSVEFQIGAGEG